MCSLGTEGFYNMIVRRYGEPYKRALKGWIKVNMKLTEMLQQKKFLLKCRQFDVLPPHIYNIRFSATIRNSQLSKKSYDLKRNYQRRLLNLEIRDMHSQIKVVDNIIKNIERFLNSKLPLDTLSRFFELNSNRLSRHNFNVKGKLINKLNKINGLQNEDFNNFLNIDKSKWIINQSNSKIPDNIIGLLGLGDKFALPINIKDQDDCRDSALGVIKNFETSSHKFPENSLDNLRTIMVKLIEKHLSNNKHIKYLDSYLLRQFMQEIFKRK